MASFLFITAPCRGVHPDLFTLNMIISGECADIMCDSSSEIENLFWQVSVCYKYLFVQLKAILGIHICVILNQESSNVWVSLVGSGVEGGELILAQSGAGIRTWHFFIQVGFSVNIYHEIARHPQIQSWRLLQPNVMLNNLGKVFTFMIFQ